MKESGSSALKRDKFLFCDSGTFISKIKPNIYIEFLNNTDVNLFNVDSPICSNLEVEENKSLEYDKFFEYLEESFENNLKTEELDPIWKIITYNQGIDKNRKINYRNAIHRAKDILNWIDQEHGLKLKNDAKYDKSSDPILDMLTESNKDTKRLDQIISAIQEQLYGYNGEAGVNYHAIKTQESRKTYTAGLMHIMNQTLLKYWLTKIDDREAMNNGLKDFIDSKYKMMNLLYKFSKKIFSFYRVDDAKLILSLISCYVDDFVLNVPHKKECESLIKREVCKHCIFKCLIPVYLSNGKIEYKIQDFNNKENILSIKNGGCESPCPYIHYININNLSQEQLVLLRHAVESKNFKSFFDNNQEWRNSKEVDKIKQQYEFYINKDDNAENVKNADNAGNANNANLNIVTGYVIRFNCYMSDRSFVLTVNSVDAVYNLDVIDRLRELGYENLVKELTKQKEESPQII